MSSTRNGDLHRGHDAHQAQYWRLSPPSLCPASVQVYYMDLPHHHYHLELSDLSLGYFPVQTCRQAVGLQHPSRNLCRTSASCSCRIFDKRDEYFVRLALCKFTVHYLRKSYHIRIREKMRSILKRRIDLGTSPYSHALERQNDKTGQDNCDIYPGSRHLVRSCVTHDLACSPPFADAVCCSASIATLVRLRYLANLNDDSDILCKFYRPPF